MSITNQSFSSLVGLVDVPGDLGRAFASPMRMRRRQHHEAETAGGGGGVDDLDALAALALARERLLRPAGRVASGVPESPPEMCTETISLPAASSGS